MMHSNQPSASLAKPSCSCTRCGAVAAVRGVRRVVCLLTDALALRFARPPDALPGCVSRDQEHRQKEQHSAKDAKANAKICADGAAQYRPHCGRCRLGC